MFDILFARAFTIVGGMLLITALVSLKNKSFETKKEFFFTFLASFAILFSTIFFAGNFPINIILVSIFSALIGWLIGPIIESLGKRFKMRKFLKSSGVTVKKGQSITADQKKEFEKSFNPNLYHQEWNNIIFQAIFATSFAVFCTAGVVFLTNFDFSFLGGFLFISLIMLVLMCFLNIFFFRSKIFSLVRAYIGAIIFTFYLLYDFSRLEKMAGDDSWGAAIDIAVNIYLDIINLFLDLLEILAESD